MDRYERLKKLKEIAAIDPKPPRCCCNCKSKLDPTQIFDDNIEDIAKSLSQIMLICGINTTKSYEARSIVKRAFVYHEKLRTTCPAQVEKSVHLSRDDMMQALCMKCCMENAEAMLAYSLIKRAFKAFFHGKPPRTISNPIVDAMAIHDQEPAWLHAAYKSARIFDNYKATFFWAHKSYEKQINQVYRALYKRMSTRADPLLVPGCPCRGCTKHEVPGHVKSGETKAMRGQKLTLAGCENLPDSCVLCGLQIPKLDANVRVNLPRPILNKELDLQRCQKCNSPFLICECNIDQLTGELFGECGQDSYKVKWFRVLDESNNDNDEKRRRVDDSDCESSEVQPSGEVEIDWENHHCPIDCQHDSSSETSDVCHTSEKTEEKPGPLRSPDGSDDDTFESCMGEEQEGLEKLEAYLNKLWAEEVAEKKNPKTYKPRTIYPPSKPCERCHP